VLACVDVDYRGAGAVAAALVFRDWIDDTPARELVATIASVPDYEPGQFYKRELPCLLEVLRGVRAELIIIDGYVHLGPECRPGLGSHLAAELAVAVVGVAKNPFHATPATPVLRGTSKKPLLVTATGISEATAAAHVRAMHGTHRIPTLLRRVDQLCREPVRPGTLYPP
jgi:deoxyribonuclease V